MPIASKITMETKYSINGNLNLNINNFGYSKYFMQNIMTAYTHIIINDLENELISLPQN